MTALTKLQLKQLWKAYFQPTSADFANMIDSWADYGFSPTGFVAATTLTSAVTEIAQDLNASSGSSVVGFLQAGANAVARTAQSKMRDIVSVKDFGAVGDGVTDDTAAFVAALAAANSVYLPWAIYRVKNVSIGTHKSIFGNGSIIKAASSATSIFTLTGFKPYLADCYLDDSDSNIAPSLGVNGGVVVVDSSYPTVANCQFVNMSTGLVLRVSALIAANQVTKGTFANLVFDTIALRGVYVGPNVNSCVFSNAQMYVGQVPSGGKAIPKAGCIGFQIVSTGTNNAAGGHFIEKYVILESETGFQFTDAQLTNVSQCIADSLKGSGYDFTGACVQMKLQNCFAGTCLTGVNIAGTSNLIWLDGIDTILQGVVPPWGDPANFFNPGAAFDVAVRNTAVARIGNWNSDAYTYYQDIATTVAFDSENEIYGGTASAVAAATTIYFTPNGANSSETPTFVAPKKGVLLELRAQNSAAPGAGESFVYTARIQFANTTLSCTTSGASSFNSIAKYPVLFNAGENITVSLVTSSAAAPANHRLVMRMKYF